MAIPTSIADLTWLGPGEPAGAPFARGASAGASIANAWQNRRQMDMQAAERAELQRVRQAEEARKAKEAAIQFAGFQDYQAAVGQGMPPDEAIKQFGAAMFYKSATFPNFVSAQERSQIASERASETAKYHTELMKNRGELERRLGAQVDPVITQLSDSSGKPVDVLRTGRNTFQQVRPPSTSGSSATPAMKDIDRANEMLKQAAELETSGDKAGADAIRADALLLKQSHTKGGMSLEVLPDGSVRFTEGGMPKTPMGVTTEFTKRLSVAEKALDTLNDLKATLRPEDVGIKGVLGELALDRILPQFGVQTADVKRMDNRTKIATLRETLMRVVSADTRFSNMDRQAIEKFLPSSGVFESFEHTVQASATLQKVLAKRALIDAKSAAMPPPAFAIRALDDKGLQEAVQADLMTSEQGASEFFGRHPELKP